MATVIPAVTGNSSITTGTFVSLQLGDNTYYVSDAYNTITVNSNSYVPVGALLSVSDFTYDYKTTQGTVEFALSGIPNTTDYMQIVQSEKIRGGDVEIRRVFFDNDTLEPLSGAEYLRFKGLISNYVIEEETNVFQGASTNSIIFQCSSVYSVLANKISGQRTNGSERRRFFSDTTFDNTSSIINLPEFKE